MESCPQPLLRWRETLLTPFGSRGTYAKGFKEVEGDIDGHNPGHKRSDLSVLEKEGELIEEGVSQRTKMAFLQAHLAELCARAFCS